MFLVERSAHLLRPASRALSCVRPMHITRALFSSDATSEKPSVPTAVPTTAAEKVILQAVRDSVAAGQSPWKWKSFLPEHTYPALEIAKTVDLSLHHPTRTLGDRVAYWVVKALRVPTDLFFKRRYGHRACMLETVAAVPGMVGGMLLHFRSLRRFEESRGWIRALLDEAENERMHLEVFMAYSKPGLFERFLVMATQVVFSTAYTAIFIISPKTAHRIVGYLEEEAIHSYTEFLKDIELGLIENVPAPEIAIAYWRLPANATLKDVVIAVRSDEAGHRDVNHLRANLLEAGKVDEAAPLGPHPHVPPEKIL